MGKVVTKCFVSTSCSYETVGVRLSTRSSTTSNRCSNDYTLWEQAHDLAGTPVFLREFRFTEVEISDGGVHVPAEFETSQEDRQLVYNTRSLYLLDICMGQKVLVP